MAASATYAARPHISLLCLTSQRKKGREERPPDILTTQSGVPMIPATLQLLPYVLLLAVVDGDGAEIRGGGVNSSPSTSPSSFL
jgi:hypothetical protein